MKIIIILLLLNCLDIQSQVTINIEIRNLKNDKGYVLFELRNNKNIKIKDLKMTVRNKICVMRIDGLNTGKFSFKYFHDENMNSNLDKNWIGIPIEGFGFSNNAKVRFGPPDFEETIFDINKDTTIICNPYYF